MTVENIFEYASRNKVRFPFKGMIQWMIYGICLLQILTLFIRR